MYAPTWPTTKVRLLPAATRTLTTVKIPVLPTHTFVVMQTVQYWHHNKNKIIVDYLLLYVLTKSRCKLPENGDYAETCSSEVTEIHPTFIYTYTVKQKADTGKIRFTTVSITYTFLSLLRPSTGCYYTSTDKI